jgi:NAD(P)-dependent dehydrogenase (short-subunit alcohol dehydrogenase family)
MQKTAIITGAGSGIGRAVALELAAQGWAVTLAGRRTDPLRETAAQAESPTLVVPTDVTDPQAVDNLFRAATEKWGRVDLLFNNAGIFPPALPLEDMPPTTWREVVDVNLSGMFYCLQSAFRAMKAQSPKGGRIINNGSISAQVPRPNSAAYTATKHAITGLTKAAALEGRGHRIAVGQIDIGNAATELLANMPTAAKGDAEPLMDVAHVARMVAQMAALPPEANVLFTTIMATDMRFVGRG